MSWLNEELPDEWPANGNNESQASNITHDLDISTSRSDESVEVAPTVAIQAESASKTPPWKRVIQEQQKNSKPGLTMMFMPPGDTSSGTSGSTNASTGNNDRPVSATDQVIPEDNSDLTSSTHTSDESQENQPINRRLKVFGRPDTYTNERLGNLLSSMGANNHSTFDTNHRTANESDMNLADDLQNEGRKVLQGLAPFRPQTIPESSLDELEQQLTSQDTERGQLWRNHREEDTTTSGILNENTSASSNSNHTLDTLPPQLRHWDSIKRNLGESPAPVRVSHKDSGETLVGSGNAGKFQPYMESQAEPDISQLRISDPANNAETSSDSVLRMQSTSDSGRESARDQGKRFVSGGSYTSIRDQTPDSVVEKYLQFPRRNTRFADSPRRTFSGATTNSADERERERERELDHSIAHRDISFSVGYELLAQLIRERMPVDISSLTDLDSLDLNNCELETVLGLDKFVPNLTTLFVNDNEIRSLHGLPFNLVHLDLSSNQLSNMNQFPSSMVSTLILANNKLQSLEPLINLRALSSLDISNNNLQSLKGIEHLTALHTLNIRNNNLRSIDLNLGLLTELDAAHNNLISVRLNTPNLETLDVSGNNIATLKDPLPNLRELYMQYNGATLDLNGFQSLKVLLFDGNEAIRNFESVSFVLETFSWEQPRGDTHRKLDVKKLVNVRDIKFGGGSQRGWPFIALNEVYATQHLDLSLLGIRELPEKFPEMFPFLKSLNLSFNKLTTKSIDVLQKCRNLERLSLFGNRLTLSGEKLAKKLFAIRMLDSRAQMTQRSYVHTNEFATDKYVDIVESGMDSPTITNTQLTKLQWLDGKWTNNATQTTVTTRPGFPSALFPSAWNPPEDVSYSRADITMAPEDLQIQPIDVVEAMYVHHWLQVHGR